MELCSQGQGVAKGASLQLLISVISIDYTHSYKALKRVPLPNTPVSFEALPSLVFGNPGFFQYLVWPQRVTPKSIRCLCDFVLNWREMDHSGTAYVRL